MSLGNPAWLMALLLAPLVALGLRWADSRRQRDLARLGDPRLIEAMAAGVDPAARRWVRRAWPIVIAALVLALSQPRWGRGAERLRQEGAQVMIVLDVSASMLAADLAPDRLTRAKLEITELINSLPGDQLGLVVFSGAAFVQAPLTTDHTMTLGFLDLARPGLISRPGTAIAAAIRGAVAGFDMTRAEHKTIVLLSDGEDPDSDPVDAAKAAAAEGIVIHTVGLGSEEGARVPETDASGRPIGFFRDESGAEVRSRLDEDVLRSIAEAGGGRYLRAGSTGSAAAELSALLADVQRGDVEGPLGGQPTERLGIFALLAAVLLLAIEALPQRSIRRAAARRPSARGVSRAAATLALIFLPGLAVGCGPDAASLNRQANEAFEAEAFATAAALYAEALELDPDDPRLQYNLGNAAYREAETERAARFLREALAQGDDALTLDTWFNLGSLALNLQELDVAVEAFKAVLRARPGDADAQHNLELALAQRADSQDAQGETDDSDPDGEEGEQSDESEGEGEGEEDREQQQGQEEEPSSSGEGEATQPSASETDGEGDAGTPTPGASEPGEGEGQATEQASAQRTPSAGDASERASGQPPRRLTREEAERLLESIGSQSESLQERLRQIYVVPGPAPAQRW